MLVVQSRRPRRAFSSVRPVRAGRPPGGDRRHPDSGADATSGWVTKIMYLISMNINILNGKPTAFTSTSVDNEQSLEQLSFILLALKLVTEAAGTGDCPRSAAASYERAWPPLDNEQERDDSGKR